MKLTFKKEDLQRGVSMVAGAAANKNTLPILANILIRASESGVELAASDLELGIKTVVVATVIEPGAITVPAKKLDQIVRELPFDEVTLETKANDRIEIVSGAAQFTLAGLDAEEFPPIANMVEGYINIDTAYLKDMIGKTLYAVSADEMRHFLNGVYLETSLNRMTMVSTDGRRLAVITTYPELDLEWKVIIPTKALQNVMRTFDYSDVVKVAVKNNQMVITNDTVTLVSRLIEGEYPDYKAVMKPALGNTIKLTVGTQHLLSVVKRVTLLANPKTPQVALKSTEAGGLMVSASSIDTGEAQETMEVTTEGGAVDVNLNAKYLIDVLRNIGASECVLAFRDALSPVLITPADDAIDYKCVIMPMRE